MRCLVALALCGLTATATAEPLTGKVLDRKSGTPIEGAVVHLQAPDGAALTTSTTADGSYGFDVVPGRYQITFLRGTAQQSATVVISADTPASLNGRLDDVVDEVIVIDDSKAPAVLPVPIRKAVRLATPPYSERAILEDAWTRAWLLLEVDARGTVTRLKLLKRPGYDLEPLAIAEGFKLKFTPARDERGVAVATLILWPIEWPAQSWLFALQGQPTRMPEAHLVRHVPYKGSGPWRMKSVYKGYRDCSRPDMSRLSREPWIEPKQ